MGERKKRKKKPMHTTTARRTRSKAVSTAATVLVLRTCAADMTSYGGFKWPKSGPVKCDDWKPRAECGNGLHGLLWGVGDGSLRPLQLEA